MRRLQPLKDVYTVERDIEATRNRIAYWRGREEESDENDPVKALARRMIGEHEARLERLMKKAEAHEG